MASNTLEIIIKANASKATATIKALDKTLGSFGTNSAKGFTALKQKWAELDAKLASPAGFKMLVGTAGAVAGALAGVGAAIKGLADNYMNYAFQVKDFGRIIGATPEEASKLIQVADDVRLSVESMTIAMKAAITKGYAPTIAELGRMSDAYLAIQDPIERSRFLVETFGRSGLEMAKLMELGSKAIEDMGASVEGTARLMTAEGIKAAEEYYTALDNIGDSWEDLTLTIGSKAMPILADALDSINENVTANIEYFDAQKLVQEAVRQTTELERARIPALSEEFNWLQQNTAWQEAKTRAEAEGQAILEKLILGEIEYSDALEWSKKIMAEYELKMIGVAGVTTDLVTAETVLIGTTDDLGKEVNDTADSFKALSGQMVMTASEIAKLSQQFATQKLQDQYFDIKARFSLPDLTSELANIVKSDKWRKAGGEVVIDIVPKLNLMGLTDEARAAVARELAAIELAVKVEIGEIDPRTAAEQLQKAFGGTGAEAKATIEAAIAVDPNSEQQIKDYLAGRVFDAKVYPQLQEIDKTTIEEALKLVPMTVEPKVEDSAVTEVKKQLGEATMTVKPTMDSVGLRAVLNQIPSSKTLTVKVKVTGLEALNNIPGGSATSPKPGPRPSGGKGATGLDMIIPPGFPRDSFPIWTTSGERVRVETPGQQKSNGPTYNIVNNYTIGAGAPMNIRDLARQITKEQRREGYK